MARIQSAHATPIEFTETVSVETITENLTETPPIVAIDRRNIPRPLSTWTEYFVISICPVVIISLLVLVILFNAGVIAQTEFLLVLVSFAFFCCSCLIILCAFSWCCF